MSVCDIRILKIFSYNFCEGGSEEVFCVCECVSIVCVVVVRSFSIFRRSTFLHDSCVSECWGCVEALGSIDKMSNAFLPLANVWQRKLSKRIWMRTEKAAICWKCTTIFFRTET